ncbi:MAG: hypothetical protein ABIQ06_12915 [Caldimonas sp.]
MASVKVLLKTLDFPIAVNLAPSNVAAAILEKGYQSIKSSLDGLARVDGEKLLKFETDGAVSDMIAHKVKSCEFYAASGGYGYGAYWSDGRVIRVLVEGKFPLDVEEQRRFWPRLNAWSHGGKQLYSDAELKKFEADYPLEPKVYKDFKAIQKDSKALVAFLDWARRKGGKQAKARDAYYDAFTGNRGYKDNDPVVVAAVKLLDEALKEYYKSF